MIAYKNTSFLKNRERIFLLLKESKYRDWPEIIWSLRPRARRRGEHLVRFLEKKGIIKNDRPGKKIVFFGHSFYHGTEDLAALIADLIAIWGNDFGYFRDKFINTGIYFFEGPYESGQVTIKNGDHVVDAGANLGLFSILASSKVGPEGSVYAFEPIARTRELLETNVKDNNLKNISIEPFALGLRNGAASFNIPDDLGSSSAVFSSEQIHSQKSEIAEMRTLDSLVDSRDIVRVDFIKADIEGSERDLLAGAKETIRKFHPRLSLCIYHRSDDKKVLTEMLLDIEPGYKISYSPTKMYAYYDKAD